MRRKNKLSIFRICLLPHKEIENRLNHIYMESLIDFINNSNATRTKSLKYRTQVRKKFDCAT